MKKLVYFSFLISILPFQAIEAQIVLDTVVISYKKKIPSSSLKTERGQILRYYFYPNLSAYYDLKNAKYIYMVDNIWVFRDNIAPNYRGYGLFNNYHIQIKDYYGDKPYEQLKVHRKKYPANYKGKFQKPDNTPKPKQYYIPNF